MNKRLKIILLSAVLIFLIVPVFTFSLLDFQKGEENKRVYEKFLAEQKALKDTEEKKYLTGKFDPAKRSDFTLIPAGYAVLGNKMYLRKETLSAFLKMRKAAEKDGIDLKIASATRNFDYQKNIWDNKWNGNTLVEGKYLSRELPDGLSRLKKILEWSAAPGTSRHHWGTDIDFNNANPEYFETEEGKKVYEWLAKNAPQFGFCQPYNRKGPERTTGYNEEKWHWSYLPLSKNFTKEYINLIDYKDITGFYGDEYAAEEALIINYVLSINPECF